MSKRNRKVSAEVIISSFRNGCSISEIGKRNRISRWTVRDTLQENLGPEYYNIMSSRFPNYKELLKSRRKIVIKEKLLSEIVTKFLSGHSVRRIAKETRFSSWSIRRILKSKLGQRYDEIVRERVKVNILSAGSKEESFELGYILGVLVGDGHLRQDCIGLSTTDHEFADVFRHFLEKWSELEPRVRHYDRLIKGKIRHVFDVYLFSADTARFIHGLGIPFGNKMRTWRVPSMVLNGGEEIKRGFLSGFFDSEGSVRLSYDVNCNSTNLQGLVQVGSLLGSFGIIYRISSYTSKNIKWSNVHVLTIKRKYCYRFAEVIDFQLPRKGIQLQKLLNRNSSN